jgi:hypothetical protein
MYFGAEDFIVEYDSIGDGVKIDPATGLARVCPLSDRFATVRIWFGANPLDPPLPGHSIEAAASLTLEAYSTLMTGEVDQACFEVSATVFDR